MDVLLSKLSSIFDDEIIVYRSLLDVTISEFEYLVTRDYKAIENHIELKEGFFQKITKLEEERNLVIFELEKIFGSNIKNVSELVELIKDADKKAEVSHKRSILSLLINRIKEANSRNSEFIGHSKHIFANVVDNFNELIKKGTTATYGKTGKLKKDEKKSSLVINKEA